MMYLVTMDTCIGYGVEIYVLGLYSSKEVAEKTIAEFEEKVIGTTHPLINGIINENNIELNIVEVEKDKTYNAVIPSGYLEGSLFVTDVYLGGYRE